MNHMAKMIIGIVIFIFFFITFVIGFMVFDEPIQLITDTFADSYPNDMPSHDDVNNMLHALPNFFFAAIGIGIIFSMIWFIAWSHKEEHEKY